MKNLIKILLLISITAQAKPVQYTVTPAPADSFVDRLGINCHIGFGGTVWDTGRSVWHKRLGELGTRYVRTRFGTSKLALESAKALNSAYGIRFSATFNARDNITEDLAPDSIAPELAFLKNQVGLDKIIAVEGPNEYSGTKQRGNTDWPEELRFFQTKLFTQVKGDAAFNNIPVIGPTIWKRDLVDYSRLGDISNFVDFGNLHIYPRREKPSIYYRTETELAKIKRAIVDVELIAPGKRIYVTETGMQNARNKPDAYLPERTSAKYVPRLLVDFLRRSNQVERVFLYNLIDYDEKGYGLLRGDLTRKPAYFAVQNLLRILDDAGPTFEPKDFTYSLDGDLKDVEKVVLQKRDGRVYLILWQDVSGYDSEKETEINPPKRRLELKVIGQKFSKLRTYLPTGIDIERAADGRKSHREVSNPDIVNLDVPDHLLIVELIP